MSAFRIRQRPLFFDTLRIDKAFVVAYLAPHPDDFDAVGMTMRRFRENGNRIELAVATSGASGVEDAFVAEPSTATKALIREREQLESCGFFGLPREQVSFLRLEEDETGHPLVSSANATRITQFLTAKRPDIVLMPHGNDTNEGHRRIYTMFSEAARDLRLSVLLLLNRDPKTISMKNDLYTVFGEPDARWKAELLRFHQSQHQRNLNTRKIGFDRRILSVNRESALALNGRAEYAEAFEIALFQHGIPIR